MRRRSEDDSDGVRWAEDTEWELMILLLFLLEKEEEEVAEEEEESALDLDDSDAFCTTASAEEVRSLPNSCDDVISLERSTSCKAFFHLL